MSSIEGHLENGSRPDIKELDIDELTEDEYSEKFYRPNYNRLHSENQDKNHVQFSKDNPSFIRDEDPEEQLAPERNNSLPQEKDVIKPTVRFSNDDADPAEQQPAPTYENVPNISNHDPSRRNESFPQAQDVIKATVRFSNDNPSFIRDEEPAEQPAPIYENVPKISKYNPSRSEETTFKAAKPSRRCLWIIIAVLSILLATMTALFIWRMICCQNKEIIKTVFKTVEVTDIWHNNYTCSYSI